MSRTAKGQTAVEFVMMMAFVILAGTVFLYSANALLGSTAEEERLAALNDLGYAIQDELILAQTVTDGYQRTFLVPQTAGRFTYEITSLPNAVILTSGRTAVTYTIPAITGSIAKGQNTIEKDGTIEVHQ